MREERRKLNIEKFSVFWRFFAMMCAFPILLFIVLYVNGAGQTRILVEKNMTEMQHNLDASCEQLTKDILAINEILTPIEKSVPYNRIIESNRGSLASTYIPSAMEVRSLLTSQAMYLCNYSEIMMYIPGVDTVCSKQAKIQTGEEYFSESIRFTNTDKDLVINNLKGKSSMVVYPMDDIYITGTGGVERQFTVTCHSLTSRSGIMLIIPEAELLSTLGFYRFPEGSRVQIVSKDGVVFEQYPSELPDGTTEYYTIESTVLNDGFTVTVWLPAAYFKDMMRNYYTNMYFSALMFLLLAFAICIIISKAYTKPLQELVGRMEQEELPRNELRALDMFITNSGLELASMKGRLVQSQLVRLFFGNALTNEEEKHLKKDLGTLGGFRVALVETERNFDQLKLAAELEQKLDKKCMYVIISRTEMGFLLSGDTVSLEILKNEIDGINSAAPGTFKKIRCGISGEFTDLGSFNDALRQARVAIPQKYEAAVFTADSRNAQNIVISWTPHEKLYRSILAKNETEALAVIRKAAMTDDLDHATIFYDNLAFVILCSANEVGINPQMLKISHYDEHISAAENFSRLENPLKKLLTMLNEKEKNTEENKKQNVMLYIRENFCDSSLCIAQIAEALKMREADVSKTVRQYTSQSFVDYVADLRMKKVVDMMADFDKSLAEIAEECGYPAESTFYRVFKAHYNKTPASYRRWHMQERDKGEK